MFSSTNLEISAVIILQFHILAMLHELYYILGRIRMQRGSE